MSKLYFIGGLLLLMVTWWGSCVWFVAITEGLLVPWDTTPMRPPAGTLERVINDFFEVPPGAYLLAVLFLAMSVVLFVIRLRNAPSKGWLPLTFAITNALFLVIATAQIGLARALTDLLLPYPTLDVGFYRNGLAILATIISTSGLMMVQAKFLAVESKRSP